MTLRLSELVPPEYEYWYYNYDTGLVLHNNPEYGWVASTNFDKIKLRFKELSEVIEQVEENDMSDPSEVLPLPDNYSGERYMPSWKK